MKTCCVIAKNMNVAVSVSTASLLLPQEETWMWWFPLNPRVAARRAKWCRPPSCSTVTPRQASASPSSCWRRMNASICLCGTPRLCVVSREETLSLFHGRKKKSIYVRKKDVKVFLPHCLAELLKQSRTMTTGLQLSPGGARRLGWCWPSCWWGWLPVCWGCCSTRGREGEATSIRQMQRSFKILDFLDHLVCTSVVSSQRAGDPEGCQLLQEGKPSLL